MRFTYLDFYLLSSDLEGTLPEALVTSEAAVVMPFIPSKDVLRRGVSKLIHSGLLEYRDQRLFRTDKAIAFFKDKKFLEGKQKRARRLMRTLCELEAEPGDFSLNDADFENITSMFNTIYHIRPAVMLCGDKLNIKSYAAYDEDCETNEINTDEYEFALSDFHMLAKNLLTVTAQMCEPTKARKLCVEATDGSYVLTLFSEGDAIRIKAQKILFNRKRFSGKLNSDLDYAQCGDVILDVKCSRLEFFESVALIALHIEDSFTDTDYENLNKITL